MLGTQCRPPRPTLRDEAAPDLTRSWVGALSSRPPHPAPGPTSPPAGSPPPGTASLLTRPAAARPAPSPPPRRPSGSPPPAPRLLPHQVPSQGAAPARARDSVGPYHRPEPRRGAGRQTPRTRGAELRQTHILGRPHGSGSLEVQWNLRTVARPVLRRLSAPPPRSPEWLRPRGPVGAGRGWRKPFQERGG